MIVLTIVIATTVIVTVIAVVCSKCNSDDSNSNGEVNKRRTMYGKLVGNGSVMENYAGCGSSCNSHNLG